MQNRNESILSSWHHAKQRKWSWKSPEILSSNTAFMTGSLCVNGIVSVSVDYKQTLRLLQALYVFMGLSLARDEFNWLLRHYDNPPSKKMNVKSHMDELVDRWDTHGDR